MNESYSPKFLDVNNVHSVTGRENTDSLSFEILTSPKQVKFSLVLYLVRTMSVFSSAGQVRLNGLQVCHLQNN